MEYHQDSFLAGIAVGRRLKGWACGGNLKIEVGAGGDSPEESSSGCVILEVFTPTVKALSAVAAEASLDVLLADYEEG